MCSAPEVRGLYDLEKIWAGAGARRQKPLN